MRCPSGLVHVCAALAHGPAAVARCQVECESHAVVEERDLSQRVSDQRLAQFRAGRHAAHDALSALEQPIYVPRSVGGAPRWPEGVQGSISHTSSEAIAVAAIQPPCSTIGVDLIDRHGDAAGVDPTMILAQNEDPPTSLVGRAANRDMRLLAVFSAKEAIYKAIFPIVRRFVDWTEVSLLWNQPFNGCWRLARVAPSLMSALSRFRISGRTMRFSRSYLSLARAVPQRRSSVRGLPGQSVRRC